MTVAAWPAVSEQRAVRSKAATRAKGPGPASSPCMPLRACRRAGVPLFTMPLPLPLRACRHNASVALFTRLRAGVEKPRARAGRATSAAASLLQRRKSRPCLGGGRKRRSKHAGHARTHRARRARPHPSRPPARQHQIRRDLPVQVHCTRRDVPAQRPGSTVLVYQYSTVHVLQYTVAPWLAAACAPPCSAKIIGGGGRGHRGGDNGERPTGGGRRWCDGGHAVGTHPDVAGRYPTVASGRGSGAKKVAGGPGPGHAPTHAAVYTVSSHESLQLGAFVRLDVARVHSTSSRCSPISSSPRALNTQARIGPLTLVVRRTCLGRAMQSG